MHISVCAEGDDTTVRRSDDAPFPVILGIERELI